jgi:glucose/arabinose dehydrogenase
LEIPWEIAFTPGETAFVTERPGRVRVVEGGRLLPEPALRLPVRIGGEGGLLGLALDPNFGADPLAYLYYTYSSGGQARNRISRFHAVRAGGSYRLEGETVLLEGIPGADNHDGGRLKFGPDGMLYATTGDAQQVRLAADRGSLAGKILRLRPDGSIPADNPFPGSPVWAWGLRNPQGLTWDPNGRLYASVHGPTGEVGLCCHDELDLIAKGAFYGWPYRAGLVAAFTPAALGTGEPPPRVEPIAESGSNTWAPSGMAYVKVDSRTADPAASLLVATLRGAHLRRFRIDPQDAGHVLTSEEALTGFGRLREVVAGPGGCYFVLTSNRDGRGSPAPEDDRVLRLCPS